MKNAFLYGIFALLLVMAAFFYVNKVSPVEFVNGLFSKQYAYNESQQGIIFASNVAPPTEIVQGMAQKDSFVLSPSMVVSQSSLNSFVSQALVQQQIVLGGHQKVTTIVVRVYDQPHGKWLGCQTDYGTAKQNEFIPVADCLPLLEPGNSILVNIEFPNPSLSVPFIELTENSIALFPVDESDIPGVNYLLLRALFSDADALIGQANQTIVDTQTPDANKPKGIDSNILAGGFSA